MSINDWKVEVMPVRLRAKNTGFRVSAAFILTRLGGKALLRFISEDVPLFPIDINRVQSLHSCFCISSYQLGIIPTCRRVHLLTRSSYQLEGPIGLDLKPVKRALKGPPRPSTSGCLGDENGPRGIPALGCLQGPFAPL